MAQIIITFDQKFLKSVDELFLFVGHIYMNSKSQYTENKNMYNKLVNTMCGGMKRSGKKSSWELIDQKKRKQIIKDYETIVNSSKPCSSFPMNTIVSAASGTLETKRGTKRKTKNMLCGTICEIHDKNNDPIVHENSLTAWANQGV